MFVVNAYSMFVVPILSTSMSFYAKFEVHFYNSYFLSAYIILLSYIIIFIMHTLFS